MEDRRVREFGRAAKAAIRRVDGSNELARDRRELLLREMRRRAVIQPRCQPRLEIGRVLLDRLFLLRVYAGNIFEHLPEAWAPVARQIGEIGTPEEWHAVRREEHRQGPAALL